MKDVVIKIVGTQNYGEKDGDSIELVTDGKYSFSDGKGEIYYSESELTGLEGTKTRLSISPLEVILSREGNMTSSTVFREGQRNQFLYDTPYGRATLGVDTRKIHANFDEHGGSMEIDYVVDMDHAVFGRNKFKINVREQERNTI
jgi:uncharacterized beta-barrel protein YwiB (DUF1934 family)